MKESIAEIKGKLTAKGIKKERQKRERFRIHITEEPLTGWDYILFTLIAVICFFSFLNGLLLG